MAFECVHCKTLIDDDRLRIPRSGAACPNCKKDPTEGWSPYKQEVADEGRQVADEMHLRILTHDYGVQEATLFFLEDLMLEHRHEISLRIGIKPDIEHKCSVCAATVPPGEGLRIEIVDQWRSTAIHLSLCERHASEGLWGQEFDLHANHPDGWLTRGDWHYYNEGKPKVMPPEP
jgi:hypothetical protein